MMSDLALSAGVSFPIIDDPVPPAAGGIGQEGDIEVPYYAYETEKAAEMQAAIEACRQAWDQIEQTLGTNIEGVIAVNVRGLMFGGGITEHPLGLAMHVLDPAEGTAPCTQPGSVLSNDGSVLVTDRDIVAGPSLPPVDPHDRLVAHELGHVLFLGHGNGRDDDGNGQFDQFCDPQEDPLAAPFTIMHPERPLTTEVITQAQRATARPIAAVTTGAQRFNSPGVSVVVSDDRADTLGDAPDPAIDLTHAGISRNSPQHSVVVSHSVRGLLGNSPGAPADRRFVMFLDTDGSAATGGSPALLGYTTTFSGAELVTAVTVTQSASGPTASGRVWQFSDGQFTEVDGIGIAASVETRMVTNEVDRFPVSDTVLLRMSDQIASNWPAAPRFQALALEVGGTSADQVPDGAPGSASVLRLTPPRFPECSVTPSQPNPGDLVTLVATGLVADAPAAVFRGERAVATARTDGNGRGVFSFSVPAAAAGGTHPLTVGVIGSALTAHCRLAADASAPLLTVPTTVVADATSPSGTVVSYSVTAVDDVDPNPVVTCTPASGSLFPLLRTTVNCAATDASGKTATARFDVLVKDANLQLADLQELIRSWNVEGGSSLLDKLASVQRFLDAGKTRQACENLSSFKSQVNAQKGKTLTPQQATELLNRATRIATLLGC
jgi:hypothetical protein